MQSVTTMSFRFELDPLWSRLSNEDRRVASAWGEIGRRMKAASDKTAELHLVITQYGEQFGKLSRTTVYRKLEAMEANGLAGALPAATVRKAKGVASAPSLPPAFLAFWRTLCGDHQRRKTLSAWRRLMRDYLIAGEVIPGYGCDWRGIWLAENPGAIAPASCPYTDIHEGTGARSPRGWSYTNLLHFAPDPDVWAGAAVGVAAMRATGPMIPHTRVGLGPMRVITMDDVRLDAYCWYPGERAPRRPVGLGVMDVATGCMVDFALVPAQERADGTVSGLGGQWARYAWANILCGIGIDAKDGVTALLEHGSAGLSPEDERRLNEILGPRPDGGQWITVQRSSTTGAPILKGLFRERGRGLPTHKAMLEAAWNLLHNELASLPAPAGRNWETAPQDVEGWTREDKELIRRGADLLAKECPEAIELLASARTHALPYNQLAATVRAVIAAMNNRRDHNLQNWLECGFVKQMVELGGALVELDRAAADFAGGDAEMAERFAVQMAPRSRRVDMSPMEAFASFGGKTVKKFEPFVATRILGPELAKKVTVDARHQFRAKDDFNGSELLYNAIVRCADGTQRVLNQGEKLEVWVNPIRTDWALVSLASGEFLGIAPLCAAAEFGQSNREALGALSLFRGEQRRRAAETLGGKINRETARRAGNARILASAEEAAGRAPAFAGVEGADVLALEAEAPARPCGEGVDVLGIR